MSTIPPESKILESVTDAIISCDEGGRILWCNPATSTISGYPPEELLGADISTLFRSDQGALVLRDPASEVPAVPRQAQRLEARHADGTTIPVSILVSEVHDGEQRVLTVVVRDATVGAERERDLERARDELGMQMRVNRALEAAESSEALVDGVLREIISLDQLHVHQKAGLFVVEKTNRNDEHVQLPLVDQSPFYLRLVHSIGDFSREFLNRETFVTFGWCLCGRAAASGQVLVSDNCCQDPRHEHCLHTMAPHPHGHYIIPLKAGGEVTGILFLYTDPNPVWDERRRVLLETLGTQIGMGFARAQADEALRESRVELIRLATYDTLTGVLNRRAIFERLAQERARVERDEQNISVILFDIDHFKRVNDRHGHAAGDAVLVEVAHRMKEALRPYDEIGRYGGEEFLMVLPGCPGPTAAEVAERLRRHLSETPIESNAGPLMITASFGVAHCTGDLTDEALVSVADDALYRAKRAGRNRVELG